MPCLAPSGSAAEAATDAEHGVFVRTIVGTDRDRIGAGIVAVTSCEVPLVVRVEVERMESCQRGCTSTDAIDAAVQLVERVAQAIDVFRIGNDGLVRVVELAARDGIRRSFGDIAFGQVGDLLAVHVDFRLDIQLAAVGLGRNAVDFDVFIQGNADCIRVCPSF